MSNKLYNSVRLKIDCCYLQLLWCCFRVLWQGMGHKLKQQVCFLNWKTNNRILFAGCPVTYCIYLYFSWASVGKFTNDLFRYAWRIKPAWIYRLSHLCTCHQFYTSSDFWITVSQWKKYWESLKLQRYCGILDVQPLIRLAEKNILLSTTC